MAEQKQLVSPHQMPGFFHWDKKSYKVDVVNWPAEYTGQKAIIVEDIAWKSQVKEWLKALPQMDSLREVHLPSGSLLPALAELKQLEHLNLETSNLKSLSLLSKHVELKSLNLLRSKSLSDPEVIGAWPKMECLALENITALYDLEWIVTLTNLRHLNMSGSMYTKQSIKSLEPLRNLKNLEWIDLRNCKVDDSDSIFVLADLPKLKKINSAHFWPKGHFTKLSEMRKDLSINGDRYPKVEELRKR